MHIAINTNTEDKILYKVLTIAGSDCSGGAGIQADIKTITVHKMYAMSVITALTAQNTVGVQGIFDVPPGFVAAQFDSVFSDIIPDAVKIGMVSNSETICIIADKLIEHKAKNIVVDPVMIASSGGKLLKDNAINTLIDKLLPLAAIITPNVPEAEVLSGIYINSEADMISAAEVISKKISGSILIKGGHFGTDANDLLYSNRDVKWLSQKRIESNNTHGTGCTLSSAIACGLAAGNSLSESVSSAKEYLTGAIKQQLDLGRGTGPLEHTYKI